MAETLKEQVERTRTRRDKEYGTDPTPEDRAEFARLWPNTVARGRQNEFEHFLRARRYRKPNDSGMDGTHGVCGMPPADSSYRCQGITRNGARAGLRCIRWACKGSRFCTYHGGGNRHVKAYMQRAKIGNVAGRKYSQLQRLPMAYSKYLSESLADRLQDLVARPLREQINAVEELGLMEIAATDAVQLYNLVEQTTESELQKLETLDEGETKKNAVVRDVLQQRMAAGMLMKDALQGVVDAREQVQRIANDKRTSIAVQDLALLVSQFVEIAYEVFGENNIELVNEYAARVRSVKLPRDGSEGTTLTPDMDVMAMDKTIPKIAG